MLTNKPKDVMLGTVKIPLADLIQKRTGMLHLLIAGLVRLSDEHNVIVFLFPNIKVSLDGLECIYLRKRVLLSTSTSWLEASISLLTSPTTQTGKESLKLLRVWAGT